MTDDTLRAAFEAHFRARQDWCEDDLERGGRGHYAWRETQTAWNAFRAGYEQAIAECEDRGLRTPIDDLAMQVAQDSIDATYKQWCGRDLMHLPLPEAVGKAIERERAKAFEEAAQACEEPVCCGEWTTGAEYMGAREEICCGQLTHQTADECAARIRALGAK